MKIYIYYMHRVSDSFSIILWAKACKCWCAFKLNRFLSICFLLQNSLIKFLLSIHSLYSWLMAYYFIAFVGKQSLVVLSYYLKILSNIIYEINPWKFWHLTNNAPRMAATSNTGDMCLPTYSSQLASVSNVNSHSISHIYNCFFSNAGRATNISSFSSLNKHLSRWIFHLC